MFHAASKSASNAASNESIAGARFAPPAHEPERRAPARLVAGHQDRAARERGAPISVQGRKARACSGDSLLGERAGERADQSIEAQVHEVSSQKFSLLLVAACIVLAGCSTTRSISNSSHREVPSGGYHLHAGRGNADPGFAYQGELNEFDVLAVDRNKLVTDEEIARALDGARRVAPKPGSSILLIQSGAVFPDGPMVAELSKHFKVTPFSGVPPRHRTATDTEPMEGASYARSLRLAAARAGAESVVCYWGTLESARRNMETKTVSWIPFAGWMVPDESQHMRIRLKLAVIDVRTGGWTMLTPEPSEDKAWSTQFTRGSSDLKQVETLKRKAFEAGARALSNMTSGATM
jgi:hypothetical protein